jgi:hypothetical protein
MAPFAKWTRPWPISATVIAIRCHSGMGEIIELSPDAAMIGHRGWFDGQAGAGEGIWIESPDHHKIDDFKNLDWRQLFRMPA